MTTLPVYKVPQQRRHEIIKIHEEAVSQGKETYTDPISGYLCFTALYHLNRGNCCGNECRHCPYNHVNVKKNNINNNNDQ